MHKKTGAITDDTRIREALPSIKYLKNNGAKVILASHMGRPDGKVVDSMRLNAVAARLSELMGSKTTEVKDCVGPEVQAAVKAMNNGDILLLENVRFHKAEEKNKPEFALDLVQSTAAQVYVNDAFGTAHRAHASTEGVVKHIKGPAVAGFLLQKELKYLIGAIAQPTRPFAAVVGGAKISTKIGVLDSLIDQCDKVLLGGAMIFTFFKARGLSVGTSLVEDDKLSLARDLEAKAKAKGVELILPSDVLVARGMDSAESKAVSISNIPSDHMGLDIGPHSIKAFTDALKPCRTVVWNGPMGCFEVPQFSLGTTAVAQCLAEITRGGAITIVGGGDSVAAVQNAKLADSISHISTGGGASLELLEGQVLPGVAALNTL